MDISIKQIKTLNLVTIDGAEIPNVDSYNLRINRQGEAILTLDIKISDFSFSDISVVGATERNS